MKCFLFFFSLSLGCTSEWAFAISFQLKFHSVVLFLPINCCYVFVLSLFALGTYGCLIARDTSKTTWPSAKNQREDVYTRICIFDIPTYLSCRKQIDKK
jgi:hypothetical protein